MLESVQKAIELCGLVVILGKIRQIIYQVGGYLERLNIS